MQNANSFHVNEECGIMPGLCKNVGWRFSERPPIHTARDHNKKKQRVQSDCHPAANIKAQSNKMPQIIAYSTQTIDSLRGKCTARKKSHAPNHATHRHSKRVGKSSAQCHSLWMRMIIAPNKVKRQSGTTCGPQTPPTRPFTLPPPNGAALLHLHKHACPSVMFASDAGTQVAFR
ncbi:hypothetical protein TcCL_Unassigned03876 [Trypanosoma cruzi]|nr:hypothetical protein TcCL_Unassigned03876 [Trypanosoma cruzi]